MMLFAGLLRSLKRSAFAGARNASGREDDKRRQGEILNIMRTVILCRIGEIALKGLNRHTFEKNLARNMRESIKSLGEVHIGWSQSRFYVEPADESYDYEAAIERLTRIFGIVSVSPALEIDSDFESLFFAAERLVKKRVESENETAKLAFCLR